MEVQLQLKYILYYTNSMTVRNNPTEQPKSLSLIHIPRFSPDLSHHGGLPGSTAPLIA